MSRARDICAKQFHGCRDEGRFKFTNYHLSLKKNPQLCRFSH
ncbi:hypothetical protein T4E_3741 [Trichinella pseudospiralis]|uniref:Uncharacterized protein n=1 Tax=Trichinella pseudospiralis TaxID=6337 RepID=A0A0V0XEH5_TRIPS|nr:hypothetical protein T4E_3741 [Trichinella pseudospiralis]